MRRGYCIYHARYYDPALGRFIAPQRSVPGTGALMLAPHDAVARQAWQQRGGMPEMPQELNRSAYARNNPLRFTDPTGHCVGRIWGAPDCRFAGWDPAHGRYGDALDAIQTGFDVAGLAPGVGELFDGANALISLARSDPVGAALAAAAMIPGAGMGATSATRAARYSNEAHEPQHWQ